MADIINLRMARKAKARAQQAENAGAARVRAGETKVAKAARKAEQQRRNRVLDGAKRDAD